MSEHNRTGAASTATGPTESSSHPSDGTLNDAIDHVLGNLSPITSGEGQLRERAQILALAIGAATKKKDVAAREAFLDELFELGDAGTGVILAVEHLTAIRLDGLPVGWLKPDVAIGPDLTHLPAGASETEQKQYVGWLEIITHIWTGKAAGLSARYTHGMSQFANSKLSDIRAMIVIMAQDIADRIDRFAGWQGDGWGCLEDHRHAHPHPNDRLVS